MTSRRFPLRLISTEHFMFYRMHLLTVAGEATARSWTSNNMCMVLLSLILSLLAKQSILLSSKTVFMFSIHRASTGPSHTIHLWSSVVSWGETIKNGHNKRQPEADVLHSWAVILNIYLGNRLSNTDLVASRHIKREKIHFRLSCAAQKRCCLNFLLSGSHSLSQALSQCRRAKRVSEQWKTSEREKGKACIPQSANYQKYCLTCQNVKYAV